MSRFLQRISDAQARGADLIGIEALQEEGAPMLLTYHLHVEGKSERYEQTVVDGGCPSLISLFGVADFLERALHNRYGLKFIGNPNLEVGL